MYYLLLIIATTVGVAAIAGWLTGYDVLYRAHEAWVTMKPTTSGAVTFLAAALWFRRWPWVRHAFEFLLAATGAFMISSYFFGASAYFSVIDDPLLSTKPGVPSLGTVLAVALAVLGLRTPGPLAWRVLTGIATLPLVGYLALSLDAGAWAHHLTYFVPGYSTAMAFPTALGIMAAAIAGDINAVGSQKLERTS